MKSFPTVSTDYLINILGGSKGWKIVFILLTELYSFFNFLLFFIIDYQVVVWMFLYYTVYWLPSVLKHLANEYQLKYILQLKNKFLFSFKTMFLINLQYKYLLTILFSCCENKFLLFRCSWGTSWFFIEKFG